jgi:hypothetical protein
VSTAPLSRALTAEAIGTFALVFAGAGAVMVDAKTHALGHVRVAISFALVIMAMIYAVGHVSGAHFNGAVMFASPPVIGTSLGALAYQFLRGEQTRPAELVGEPVASEEEAA